MNYAATSIADDLKYELVDGTEFMMSPPKINHQRIGGNLLGIIGGYLHGKRHKVFYSASVIFDAKNHFIPDILVICDKNKIKPDAIYGAPDFVVEILSPSTKKRDLGVKKDTYEKYGVKEYWIINPQDRSITAYLLQDGKFVLDNVYFDLTEEDWNLLDDKEQAEQKLTLKISLYDDLEISVKDVFEE